MSMQGLGVKKGQLEITKEFLNQKSFNKHQRRMEEREETHLSILGFSGILWRILKEIPALSVCLLLLLWY